MGNQKRISDGEKYQGEENNFKPILFLHRGKIDLYKNPTQQIDFRKRLWGSWGKNDLYQTKKHEYSLPTNFEDVYGITGAKMTSINSQNENTPCPLAEQHQNRFLGMQK